MKLDFSKYTKIYLNLLLLINFKIKIIELNKSL